MDEHVSYYNPALPDMRRYWVKMYLRHGEEPTWRLNQHMAEQTCRDALYLRFVCGGSRAALARIGAPAQPIRSRLTGAWLPIDPRLD